MSQSYATVAKQSPPGNRVVTRSARRSMDAAETASRPVTPQPVETSLPADQYPPLQQSPHRSVENDLAHLSLTKEGSAKRAHSSPEKAPAPRPAKRRESAEFPDGSSQRAPAAKTKGKGKAKAVAPSQPQFTPDEPPHLSTEAEGGLGEAMDVSEEAQIDKMLEFEKELAGENSPIALDWPADMYWQDEEVDIEECVTAYYAEREYEELPEPWWVWNPDCPPPDVLAWYYERAGMQPPPPFSQARPSQGGIRPPSTSQFLFSVPECATRYTLTRNGASPGSDTAMQVDTSELGGETSGAAARHTTSDIPHAQNPHHSAHQVPTPPPPLTHPSPAAPMATTSSMMLPTPAPALTHTATHPPSSSQAQPPTGPRNNARPTFKVGEPFTLAPTPEGGWKRPAGVTTALLVRHTRPESRRMQLERTGPKLLVQILGVTTRTLTAPLAVMFQDAIASHPENANEKPHLGFPKFTKEAENGTREPIFTALLSNISLRFYHTLLAQVCISVNEFTAFIYPAEDNAVVTDFAFVMQGLSLKAEDHDLCRQLVRRVLLEDPSFRRVVGQRRDNILPSLSLDQAVAYLLDSIRAVPQVNALPGNSGRSVVLFNIHIASPTKITKGHEEWISYLTGKTYEHTAFGFGCGTAKPDFMCIKCGGFDHPVGKCPIPALVGKEPEEGSDPNSPLFLLEACYRNEKRFYAPQRGKGGRQHNHRGGRYRASGYR
ncbi:hypothetical protein D9613_010234 [Agrocybe pediades]|uniref:Uncharacterized protein n=1 Tax=Agrocybe pediades TaxID=84607 RepID=A0A8H4VJG6_9AGAR|nr:hypothetical protein D9613_010234 [Agrocybe pediades]